ncbi:MAG: DUF364 domain-containing protein, partial [Heliobacteriaceae bacterium]|nr:DUF364 domain-containing protein [Heliobacteriaceae bacterium]
IIGYQPAILENCVRCFGPDHVRITDLNPDNTGKTRYGVTVWDGFTATEQLIAFADVILITGSVLANGTFNDLYPLLTGRTFYFYGTTAAALANLNGFPRLCYKSR